MHASAIATLSGFTVDAMRQGESLPEFLKRLARERPDLTESEFAQRYFTPLKITSIPLGNTPHREPKDYDIELINGLTVSPFSRDGATKWDKQASELHQRYGVPLPMGRDQGNTFMFISPVPQPWLDGDTKALLVLEEAPLEAEEAPISEPAAEISTPASAILDEAEVPAAAEPPVEVPSQIATEPEAPVVHSDTTAPDSDQSEVLEQLQAQLGEAPPAPEVVQAKAGFRIFG